MRRKPACMEGCVFNDNFSKEAHLCMAAVVSSTDVPTNIQEALDDPNWKAAMSSILRSTTKFGNLFQNQRTGRSSAASGILLSNTVQMERYSNTRPGMWRKGSFKSSMWTTTIPTPQPCDFHLCDVYGQSQCSRFVWCNRWTSRPRT